MNLNNYAIGQKIKIHRKALKMTQPELAVKIGKTESSIRKYEKGEVTIPLNVLETIAKVLEVNMFELMIDEDALAKEVKEIEAFENYLNSIGYTAIYLSNPEDETGESFCFKLTKDNITKEFNLAEFESFQQEIKKSVDYQFWLKSQGNKK